VTAQNTGSRLAGARILVTGGAGFIGRHVVRALTQAGASVLVADQRPGPVPDGGRALIGDLCDQGFRERIVTADLDGIVHLAAAASVLASVNDPAGVHDLNVTATAALLELARVKGVPRFMLASTNAVVGDAGDSVIDEKIALRPLTPYGASKAACEMLLSAYQGSYGMTTCALRLTNVYGTGMAAKDSFVPRIMRAARDGGKVEIYGSGEQRRDLVNVMDVVQGLVVAWQQDATGPVVIGSGESVSVLDLLEAARKATGIDIPARHIAAKQGEMPAVRVDIGRAAALGYEPAVSLEDGLREVWADFRRTTRSAA
jgi:UDP-glucose 4-epimerase